MYLTPTTQHWACDIETDGLLDTVSKIHCVSVENVLTGEKRAFTSSDGPVFVGWLESVKPTLVGHNFLAFDAVVLNRFWNARIPVSRVVDTFVLSQLYNPGMPRPKGLSKDKGGHSLEAWGLRLKFPKTEHQDFSEFTPEMLEYCINDTALTAKLFRKLSERMRSLGFSEYGCELEHKAWHIIQNKQKKNGFPFNKKEAELLYAKLRQRQDELAVEIEKLWPPKLLPVEEYKRPFKANGEPTANFERHSQQFTKLVLSSDKTSYTAYDYVSFKLGSPSQRVEKLLELGWEPVEFTKKTEKGGGGNPKVDEDSLTAFAESSGRPEIKALAKWIVINSRANMLFSINKKGEETGWLTAYNDDTGCIHGSVFIAATLRYKHSNPNTANIPAVRLRKNDDGTESILYGEDGSYTYECRDLWYAGDDQDFALVGIDAKGIQNRCLIHYLIKTVGEDAVAEYRDLSLKADIHVHNIDIIGAANKAASKKFFYTLMMGGGGERLAADQVQFGTRWTPGQASAKKRKLIKSMPGFGELIKKLQAELEDKGRIVLCDGTPILVSSPHMVIPYLLQGDESRLMKQAMVYVDEEIRREKLTNDVFKVVDVHDEWQFKVRKSVVERFITLALPCFNRAGERFKYLVPIDGDAKVGRTWAETH